MLLAKGSPLGSAGAFVVLLSEDDWDWALVAALLLEGCCTTMRHEATTSTSELPSHGHGARD